MSMSKSLDTRINDEHLKLSNQLCFPVYAASRLITQSYKPHLDRLGITYPQYLVLLVLWESDGISVNQIAQRLILDTNTVTPLLKRMETLGLLTRRRSGEDERKVTVSLTTKGKTLRTQAATIPQELVSHIINRGATIDTLLDLRDKINGLLEILLNNRELQS